MRYQEGMIVKSDAGHDQERFYVIVAAEDRAAYSADGKRRKLEKPKRKNICHLKRTGATVDLSTVDTNRKLRQVLRDFESPASSAE